MTTNWFDIIYLAFVKNGYTVDNDKYNEICSEEDEIDALENDARKKADHFYDFINKQQLSTTTTALFT